MLILKLYYYNVQFIAGKLRNRDNEKPVSLCTYICAVSFNL